MIRIIAKLFALTVILAAFLHVAPVLAAAPLIVYVSSTGSDGNPCTAALPCATLTAALSAVASGGQVNCLNPPYGLVAYDYTEFFAPYAITIDCPGVMENTSGAPLSALTGPNEVVKILNLTMRGPMVVIPRSPSRAAAH